jgi:membrane fusion protein, multidrug efflux system
MSKNKFIVLAFFILGLIVVSWRLYSSKKEMIRQAELSLESPDFLPVKVVTPHYANGVDGLKADGIFMPIKEMWIMSETQGRITEVYKAKGEMIKAGEAIARVDDELLRLELETVQLNLDKLEKDKVRLNRMIEADAVAKNKVEEVSLAIATAQTKIKVLQKQLNNTTIRSPMDGMITFKLIEPGGVIGLGIQVAQVTDISSLLLVVRVPELDLHRIKKGNVATIVADAFPDKPMQGIVKNIGIKADQAFTFDIDVEVKNTSDRLLKAGMHASSSFQATSHVQALYIPIEALVGSRKEAKVYIIGQYSTAKLVSITIGEEKGGDIEVKSGLSTTDQVIINGQFTLAEGNQVKIIAD